MLLDSSLDTTWHAGLAPSVHSVSLVPAGNPLRSTGRRHQVHLTGSQLAPLGSLPGHLLDSLTVQSGSVDGKPYFTNDLGARLVGRMGMPARFDTCMCASFDARMPAGLNAHMFDCFLASLPAA